MHMTLHPVWVNQRAGGNDEVVMTRGVMRSRGFAVRASKGPARKGRGESGPEAAFSVWTPMISGILTSRSKKKKWNDLHAPDGYGQPVYGWQDLSGNSVDVGGDAAMRSLTYTNGVY